MPSRTWQRPERQTEARSGNAGFEPGPSAWRVGTLPLSYARFKIHIICIIKRNMPTLLFSFQYHKPTIDACVQRSGYQRFIGIDKPVRKKCWFSTTPLLPLRHSFELVNDYAY